MYMTAPSHSRATTARERRAAAGRMERMQTCNGVSEGAWPKKSNGALSKLWY